MESVTICLELLDCMSATKMNSCRVGGGARSFTCEIEIWKFVARVRDDVRNKCPSGPFIFVDGYGPRCPSSRSRNELHPRRTIAMRQSHIPFNAYFYERFFFIAAKTSDSHLIFADKGTL